MSKKPRKSTPPVVSIAPSESEAIAALRAVRAYLEDGHVTMPTKDVTAAFKAIDRYVRDGEREVAAEKMRLKDESGIDVERKCGGC